MLAAVNLPQVREVLAVTRAAAELRAVSEREGYQRFLASAPEWSDGLHAEMSLCAKVNAALPPVDSSLGRLCRTQNPGGNASVVGDFLSAEYLLVCCCGTQGGLHGIAFLLQHLPFC